MKAIEVLKLIIRGDAKGAVAALKSLGSQARDVGQRMNAAFESVKDSVFSLRGALAAIGVGTFFRKVISETVEEERALAQLNAVLKSTQGAAGLTAEELNAMADEFARTTTFGGDAITTAQSVLLTYTTIGRETFPRAVQAALDFATALGVDTKAAAETVGRALGTPTRAMAALARQGFVFTEAQQLTIKQFEEQGRLAEAQAIILEELELAYGGSAQAARDTLGGALAALNEAFNDLLTGGEGGIQGARDGIEGLIDTLRKPELVSAFGTLTSAVLERAGELAEAVQKFVEIGEGVGIFLARVRTGVDDPNDLLAVTDASIRQVTNELRIARDQYESYDRFVEGRAEAARRRIEELETRLQSLQSARTALERDPFPDLSPGSTPSSDSPTQQRPRATLLDPDAVAEAERAAKKEEKRREQIARTIESLREEAATHGATAGEIALYRLEQLGATEAELERAQGLVRATEAQELFAEASEELKRAAAEEAEEAKQAQRAREEFAEEVRRSIDPTRALRQELEVLHETQAALVASGSDAALSQEELAAAVEHLEEKIAEAGKKTDELSVFGEQAARNMQDAFADFLFDPFDEGLEGMVQAFVNALRRMVAEAVAAKLFEKVFGAIGKGGEGEEGGAGEAAGFFATLFASIFHDGGIAGDAAVMRKIPEALFVGAPKFHAGGRAAGLTSDEVPAILRRGERVLNLEETREYERSGGGRTMVNVNVQAPNPRAFTASETQIAAGIANALIRARNRQR